MNEGIYYLRCFSPFRQASKPEKAAVEFAKQWDGGLASGFALGAIVNTIQEFADGYIKEHPRCRPIKVSLEEMYGVLFITIRTIGRPTWRMACRKITGFIGLAKPEIVNCTCR